MFDLLFSNPPAFIIIFGGIIIAIGIHEAAHCYMADYLGDPTPRSLGRLTLNPLAHLDPMGTLVILITAAGPVSNLLLAIGLSLLTRFLPIPPSLFSIVYILVRLNIFLALFNL